MPMIDDIDVKTLNVFDAMMRKGNRQLAADELGITLGKMHYHIEKMRSITDNLLFVRENNSLCPTPFSISIHPKIKKILSLVNETFSENIAFDFTSEKKHFCILCNEYFAQLFAYHLIDRLEELSEEMTLSFEVIPDPVKPNAIIDHCAYYESLLRSEKASIAILSNTQAFGTDHYKRSRIFRDQYAWVHNEDNKAVLGSSFEGLILEDTAVKFQNSISGSSALITAINNTLFKAKIPNALLTDLTSDLNIEMTDEHYDLYQYWHINQDRKDDHKWLRKYIRNTCREYQ